MQLYPPSDWIVRWAHLARHGGTVLDVACGPGRHAYWLHARGLRVTAVDRAPDAMTSLQPLSDAGAEIVHADIESGAWPFHERRFDAVVVTNYLWRPRLPDIVAAVAPGGVLMYETFAVGNETVGKPSRADFLLQPGELLAACTGLRVVAYEDGFLRSPDRFVQRVAAVRPAVGLGGSPERHPLGGPAPGQ